MAVIKELEEKKNAALKHAWEQVNRDFGSIFGKLLPGANAKLSTLPGKTVLDGLEVNNNCLNYSLCVILFSPYGFIIF